MPSASLIAHAGLAFANPMSAADVDAAIEALALPADACIVDVGCGTGEMLVRAVRHHGARGRGIDNDPEAIAQARRRADDVAVVFAVGDATSLDGGFDAVINVGASHALGGFPAALAALGRLAPVILYGEGFWHRPPTAQFLAALGGASEDELADLPGLRAAIHAAGFDIVCHSLATESDWTGYEETLAANAERDGGANALAYARRIRERRALPGGTDTLGFALFVLHRC